MLNHFSTTNVYVTSPLFQTLSVLITAVQVIDIPSLEMEQINPNIGSFVAAMGVGTLQVRTYLNSDGVTPCEVDNILIQGQKF